MHAVDPWFIFHFAVQCRGPCYAHHYFKGSIRVMNGECKVKITYFGYLEFNWRNKKTCIKQLETLTRKYRQKRPSYVRTREAQEKKLTEHWWLTRKVLTVVRGEEALEPHRMTGRTGEYLKALFGRSGVFCQGYGSLHPRLKVSVFIHLVTGNRFQPWGGVNANRDECAGWGQTESRRLDRRARRQSESEVTRSRGRVVTEETNEVDHSCGIRIFTTI